MLQVDANFKAFNRSLNDAARRQIPFAAALAINDVLEIIETDRSKDLERKFRSPTPFTKRGIYKRRATKRRLIGEVGFKDIQRDYLFLNVTGGVRTAKRGKPILVPVKQRTNRYGNLPRGAVRRMTGRDDVFVASKSDRSTSHLKPGVYQRTKRKGGALKLLLTFEDRARYRPRYKFEEPAAKAARKALPKKFTKRLIMANSTAR